MLMMSNWGAFLFEVEIEIIDDTVNNRYIWLKLILYS